MLKIFNLDGDDAVTTRQIFQGNSTGIINLNKVKYKWAVELWRSMRENFWIAEKIDLSQDVVDYNNLLESEKKAFNSILGYLVFLDSVQVQNLPHLIRPCSSPEISICFSEQLSQESLHSQSYSYVIETVISVDNREHIYNLWRDDKLLCERCKLIADYYQNYIDNPTEKNHYISLIADYILEGLYFYVGFIFFYNLSSRSLMSGTADIFRYINRDELSHVRLYSELLKDCLAKGMSATPIYDLIQSAVQKEIEWSCHVIGKDVLGITPDSIEQYIKHLADLRLRILSLKPLYGNPKNPFKHLEAIANTSKDANLKTNFFDGNVTSYNQSSAVEGWEHI